MGLRLIWEMMLLSQAVTRSWSLACLATQFGVLLVALWVPQNLYPPVLCVDDNMQPNQLTPVASLQTILYKLLHAKCMLLCR